jgi:peptide/nickel transport system ATP-binding protein
MAGNAFRSQEPMLEIRHLVTEFATRRGPFRAVDDVSLDLHPGETLCLVGESGSGKSVLARSILQIVDPPGGIASGEILFNRRMTARGSADDRVVDLAALHPRSKAIRAVRGREIAMIFQEPMSSLSPVHRIGEQIGEVLRLHEQMPRKEARLRAIELLQQVGIPSPQSAIDRYPFEYSGGMRQRAMIAMALACDPAILIADEPTTALDVSVQAEILALIKSLQHKSGMAVLFITHDMGVVAEIADRIVVMRKGVAVEHGGVLEIFNAPQHEYTRNLLDAVRHLERPSTRRLAMRVKSAIGPTILRATRVTKQFDALTAVDGVSLTLRAGENLGIVGESGSGKTTLGRCLQRIYRPETGEILYSESGGTTRDIASVKGRELRTAWRDIRTIFQDPFGSLNPRMTVGQIIGEPLLTQGTVKGEALRGRVLELLEQVGMPATSIDRYPHAFSGGQRQRISIARAIAPNPRIIIADEATSALDVNIRTQILDLLLDLQERLQLSFVLISHDIAVVRYFCDRIAVMHRGAIVETGDTEAVCSRPQHPYTAALLSAVPIADPSLRGTRIRKKYAAAN